jgi:hypothetical protein
MVSGAVGNKLYVFGGTINSSLTSCPVLSGVQMYDAGTDKWYPRQPMLTARSHFALGTINGIFYVIGGDVAKGNDWANCVPTAAVEAYDPKHNRWANKAPMPEARCCFGAATGKDSDGKEKLYVFGGSGKSGSVLKTVYAYDPNKNRWSRKDNLPHPGKWLAGTSVNGTIYAIGRTAGIQRDVLQPYNPSKNIWVENLPKEYSDDYGGNEGLWAGVEYSPGAREWTRPYVGVIGNDIYIVEGTTEGSHVASDIARIDIYRPLGETWRSAPSVPADPSDVVTLAIAGHTIYVLTFGGPDDQTKSYVRNWRLTGWWLHLSKS